MAETPVASSRFRTRLAELHPRRFFLETWERADAAAEAERRARREAGAGYDVRPVVAYLGAAVLITLMEYWGDSFALDEILERIDRSSGYGGESLVVGLAFSKFGDLIHHTWWIVARVLGFLVVPAWLVRRTGDRIRDQGLATAGFREHAWIYALAYVGVFVCVVAVSFDRAFQTYYPFYDLSSRSWLDFLLWEAMYAFQFFALEFFFRGYLLTTGARVMGSYAIFASVIPYVMIHFGKPLPETLAATFAGVVLGTLALKTRSIWSGFLIHVSVALSMDVASLLQTGRLPTSLWP